MAIDKNISPLILNQLLSRRKTGKSGFVMVVHPGEVPKLATLDQIEQRLSKTDNKHFIINLSALGDNPVKTLIQYQREKNISVFSVLCDPDAVWHGNTENIVRFNAINFSRSHFFAAGLSVIFWVNHEGMRMFHEHASNFLDFRLRLVEEAGDRATATQVMDDKLPSHNLPTPSLGNIFVGRNAILKDIENSLQGRGSVSLTQHLTVQGLGGVGKTRLAVEYAWRHLHDYHTILFTRADSPLGLNAGLAELNNLLRLPVFTELSQQVEATLGWLETHDNWLLIIDNADTETAAAAVEALIPRLSRGATIITSRYRRWGKQLKTLALDTFSDKEAAQYLLLATKGARTEETLEIGDASQLAQKLASKLGYIPFALELAAATISAQGLSIRQYLSQWETEVQKSFRRRGSADNAGYPHSVAVTLNHTLSHLSPTANVLLRLCTWFAPSPILESLFFTENKVLDETIAQPADHEQRQAAIDAALDQLSDYALIRRHSKTADQEGRMFDIHRVIFEVMRTQYSASEKENWITTGANFIQSNIPDEADPTDVRSWYFWQPMRPHVEALINQAEQAKITTPTSLLMNQLGLFLYAQALHKDAEPLMRKALEILEVSLGKDHPHSVVVRSNLKRLLLS